MIPMNLLSGAGVFVAGGAGHVGRVLVGSLLRAGAAVAVSSRDASRLDALRAELDAPAERLVTIVGDVAGQHDGPRVRDAAARELGGIDAAVASLGGFVVAPSVLDAPTEDLRRALEHYVVAHHRVARTLIPAVGERDGSYTFINGFLGFGRTFPGAGLVSAATAAQAMLTRIVMQELDGTGTRVNEVVLYSSFGRADDDERNRGTLSKEEVGRFVVELVSPRGAGVRGQTIHLESADAAVLRPVVRV